MDPRRPRPGELVAGAGGALLLISTFLPWFGLDSAVRLPGRAAVTVRGDGVSAWHAFAFVDIVLLLAALAALALLALRPLGTSPARTPLPLVVIGAGLVCALLIVYRLLDPPGLATAADTAATETGRRIGPFFALLATAGMTWGAWRAIEDGAIEDKPFEVAEAPIAEPEPEPEPGPEPVAAPVPSPSGPSGPPIRSAGVAAFDDVIARLEPLLTELWDAPAAPRGEQGSIPTAPGVYLFTRHDEPVHVGQALDLRRRLAEQCRPSSSHTKATLAFDIARRAASREGIDVDGPPARLATSDPFVPYFARAKEAVASLPVRFLEVESSELRAVFEVYAGLALGTREHPDSSH